MKSIYLIIFILFTLSCNKNETIVCDRLTGGNYMPTKAYVAISLTQGFDGDSILQESTKPWIENVRFELNGSVQKIEFNGSYSDFALFDSKSGFPKVYFEFLEKKWSFDPADQLALWSEPMLPSGVWFYDLKVEDFTQNQYSMQVVEWENFDPKVCDEVPTITDSTLKKSKSHS